MRTLQNVSCPPVPLQSNMKSKECLMRDLPSFLYCRIPSPPSIEMESRHHHLLTHLHIHIRRIRRLMTQTPLYAPEHTLHHQTTHHISTVTHLSTPYLQHEPASRPAPIKITCQALHPFQYMLFTRIGRQQDHMNCMRLGWRWRLTGPKLSQTAGLDRP